jgi:Ca2+-transporting ATPase
MSSKFYNLDSEQVLVSFNSAVNGLPAPEARLRLTQNGYNELPREKSFSWFLILLSQFKSSLIYILLAAAVISFILGDTVDAWVILAAVGLNVVVGFFQEWRAQKSLEKLREVVTQTAQIRRDGQEITVEARELVAGDIVLLRAGNKVPADIRLMQANNLRVDEASLTGESVPVKKITVALPSAVIVAERKNSVFMGTTIVAGSGEGVVTATGSGTEIGQIARLIKETQEEETPLQKKLSVFSRKLGVIILFLAGIIFLIGLAFGYEMERMFTTAVALAVAAIPEGLVVVVTVILAIGMQRILKHKALVRRLVAAETLGSTTVICTDKTGTLTEGVMRVVRIITHDHDLDTSQKSPRHQEIDLPLKSYFLALKIGILSSDAYIENPHEVIEHRRVFGLPTEKALILAADQAGLDVDTLRRDNSRLAVIPFDSEQKFMATLCQDKEGHHHIYTKGAPEKILEFSSHIDLDGKIEALNNDKRERLKQEFEKLSFEGLRILALGFKKADNKITSLDNNQSAMSDLVFVGFVGIKDPLRREAHQTIELCQKAGLRPVMLTGDHRLTAQAIARELGLPHEDKNIIEGSEFEKLDEDALKKRITEISVYARLNPQDKLRIIDAWQARGEVVAMTGDGVNDAPALKSADIGVALGSGTDVAKETADIVLLDNNFRTIVRAVQEGRLIYDNIKKVILYLLSDGFTEIVIIAVSILLGWPLPLAAAQILWINLVTDGFPNIALTVEPDESETMSGRPVSIKQPILDNEMKAIIIAISLITGFVALGLFYWLWQASGDIVLARTVIFTAVAVDSLFYVFSSRSLQQPIWKQKFFSNKYLIVACLLGLFVQLLAIYLPFFQKVLGTVPLDLFHWIIVLVFSGITVAAMESIKWIFIRQRHQA